MAKLAKVHNRTKRLMFAILLLLTIVGFLFFNKRTVNSCVSYAPTAIELLSFGNMQTLSDSQLWDRFHFYTTCNRNPEKARTSLEQLATRGDPLAKSALGR
jgi:hypothetical protein